MSAYAKLSLWDPAYNPKTEHNSSKEYIEKYLKNHFWLRASSREEAYKILDKMAKSPNVKNIYTYTIGLRPGKPVPVAEFVMEVEINSKNEYGMLLWSKYYSEKDEAIKDSEIYNRIDKYWRMFA